MSIAKLPDVPQTELDEPLAQCGVLYLGTAAPAAGLEGLNSVQEPLSRRYPVDGTNIVKGIDSILTVYENGVQIQFARHPYVVIFYPIASLVYCASLRYAIVNGDPSKQSVPNDWCFAPLDALQTKTQSKHPPVFCAVFQRSQVLLGEDCHCFITKSNEAALALVKAASTAYSSINPASKCLKSPIFYQLDRYGRKLTETNGAVYLSPADGVRKGKGNNIFDTELDGYFYKTDTALIEVWQLWDEDDVERPKPPPSPFGYHQGIIHDDTINELNNHLKHMDDNEEKRSRSCSCSSRSSSRTSSSSDCPSQMLFRPNSSASKHSRRRQLSFTSSNNDQFNPTFSHLQTSTFEPVGANASQNDSNPVVIEKYISEQQKPESVAFRNNFQTFSNDNNHYPQKNYILEQSSPSLPSFPVLHPTFYQPQEQQIQYVQEQQIQYAPVNTPLTDLNNFQVNEKGERITNSGNRIVFMDVVTPSLNMQQMIHRPADTHRWPQQQQIITTSTPYTPYQHPEYRFNEPPVNSTKKIVRKKHSPNRVPRQRSRRRQIPVIDIQNIEHLLEGPSNTERLYNPLTRTKHGRDFEMIDGYLEDNSGRKLNLNRDDAESMLTKLRQDDHRASTSSSMSSSKGSNIIRQSKHSTTLGSAINYAERGINRSFLKNLPDSQLSTMVSSKHSANLTQHSLGSDHVKQYVENIYGASQREQLKPKESKRSTSNKSDNQPSQPITTTLFQPQQVTNETYMSPLRYMQNNITPLLLREYRKPYV
ncbi:unnamed protein product [Didymodactylos carnosus]|uniref:Uncharacterized protein n=1 Tax=Didymodactylos carnosus TaxID=1234261 RepID=A0A8S2NFQ7_9BILA|nr:unnamed protein product [Didymodactylos carnosus]CAF3998890.1 unnamed protein product [Didymodactylos carnosus]